MEIEENGIGAEGQPLREPAPEQEDWFIQYLVSLADDGIEFGVTLVVPGGLISGVMIGGKKFFESLRAFVAPSLGAEAADSFIAAGLSLYIETEEERAARQPRKYVHLKDARIYSPDGGSIPGNGLLWRGRINAVSGVSVGSFDTKPPAGTNGG